jgi:hypothetical protein
MSIFGGKKDEGLIEKYKVNYKGGHPDYKKKKIADGIKLNLYEDCFELPKIGFKGWSKTLTIPYKDVIDVQTVEPEAKAGFFGTLENAVDALQNPLEVLGSSVIKNTIHITYETDGLELMLRLEMVSGTRSGLNPLAYVALTGSDKARTSQACLEMMDLLRTHKIRAQFRTAQNTDIKEDENLASTEDIPIQLEKLADLLRKKIITQEEFDTKKTELLERI